MRTYLVVLVKGERINIVTVKGTDMIRLVAACDRNNVKCTVIKCL